MDDPSRLEKVSGSLGVGIGATAIAAVNGTWLAALLPLLAPAIGAGRFQQRVEGAIREINDELERHVDEISALTDQQFKLLNESMLAILMCTENEKIAMLKSAVINSLSVKDLDAHEAAVLSRALREVSAIEMHFLKKIAHHRSIMVVSAGESAVWEKPEEAHAFPIEAGSSDNEILAGLVNLGLIISTGSGFGGTINYMIGKTARRLAKLVER